MKAEFSVEYQGVLVRDKMTGYAKTAYSSWKDQRGRCTNPRIKSYPSYGGRGLKVSYSSREFISWWLSEVKTQKLSGNLVCERIDHNKGYFFGNIKLGTRQSNAKEVGARAPWKKGVVLISPSGRLIRGFASVKAAALFAGVSSGSIVGVCKGNYECTTKGQVFRYEVRE